MKKVTILSLAAHRDATLNALRGLGVMHLAPFHPPAGGDLESARRAHEDARQALSLLESLDGKPSPAPAGLPPAPAGELLQQTVRLAARKHERAERRQHLSELIRHQEPYGDFEPGSIRELAARGLSIRLYQADPKAELELPEDALRVELRRDKNAVYFAVVNGGAWSSAHAIERPIPERSLGALRQERADLEAAQAREDAELEVLVPHRDAIAGAVAAVADRLRWTEAREGMSHDGPLLFLQGFLPAADLPKLEAEAKRQGWGWQAEDPGETDAVPTLLRHSWLTRPIALVFEALNILPGYRESDISPIFLAFFTLFFAMLVSDAVYGLIFLGLTFLIKWKWKAAPPTLTPLLGIMGTATLVWGVLTGSYLGIENVPAPLDRVIVEKLTDRTTIWNLCFLIGAVHLTLAHLWNIWLLRRSLTALSHLGWIGSCWTMYFIAAAKILRLEPFPHILPLFGVSVFLILVFTIPFNKLKSDFATLLSIPFSIVGNFSDIVSYLRLYLVGFASVVLVKAFNGIAFGDGEVTLMRGIFGAVLIFLIHILNLMLSILAVLVHGVRLNALEFSTHMGIQWSGFKYSPFKKISIDRPLIQPEEGRAS